MKKSKRFVTINIPEEGMTIKLTAKFDTINEDFNSKRALSIINKMSMAFACRATHLEKNSMPNLSEEYRNYHKAFHKTCDESGHYL